MLYSCPRFSSMRNVIWKIWSATPLCLDNYVVRRGRRVCMRAQSCLTLCNLMDCSWPGSSVHGISQSRVLEWVAISSSRGDPGIKPSQPREWTCVYCSSCIGRWILYHWVIWKVLEQTEHIVFSLLRLLWFWNHLDENPRGHKNAPPRSPATVGIADGQPSKFTSVFPVAKHRVQRTC